MTLNLKPILTNEQYVQYMARESKLYDPSLAVDKDVGSEYMTMMSNLAGKDIDVSKYDLGIAKYLSNEDKVNYIWNNYFNDDPELTKQYNEGFADKAYHERNRQIYESKSGIEKTLGNIGGAFAALGEGIASIPNDLYTTFTGLAWTFTGDSYWQKKTQEGLYDIHGSMEEYYEQYTNFTRSDIGNITYEVFQNIGRMAPMIVAAIATSGVSAAGQAAGWSAKAIAAASTAIQVAGAATYYATIPGQTYQEILNNPNYKITSDAWASNKGEVGRWQIFTYAMGSVAIEAFTESAFASKIFKFGIVDPDKVAVKIFSNKIAQSIAAFTMDALGEGIEEMVSEILEPMLKTAVIDRGSFSEVMASPNFKDIIHAGLVGALSGAIMGGGARLTGKIATRQARAEMGGVSYTQYSAIQNMLKDTKTSNAVTKLQAELSAKGINLNETQITKLRQGQQLTEADLTSEQKTNVLDANQYINDFQKASETLAKNEETASKAAAIMLKVYQTLGESDFTKAMTMWLSSEQSKLDAIAAFKGVEGKTQWENLDAKKTAVVNDFNTNMKSEGVAFQPTATPLTQNQRVLSNLLKTYGIDTIFGKYIDVDGSGTRTVYNAHAANKTTVLIDEALFSRYSQQYIINQIVNEEIGHTLQMNVEGAVSMSKLVALQKTLQQLNGAHQDADMSAYANLDPKSVEYNAEAQAKSWISPLFYLDQKTIGDIFKVDKGVFTVLSRTLKDMKKKAQPKAGTDLYTRTMYRTLAMASMMYDTAIISSADTVEQAKAMASRTNLFLKEEDIRLTAAEIEKRLLQTNIKIPFDKSVQAVKFENLMNGFCQQNFTETGREVLKSLLGAKKYRNGCREILNPQNYNQPMLDGFKAQQKRTKFSDYINDILMDSYDISIDTLTGDMLHPSNFTQALNFQALQDSAKAALDAFNNQKELTPMKITDIWDSSLLDNFTKSDADTISKGLIQWTNTLDSDTAGQTFWLNNGAPAILLNVEYAGNITELTTTMLHEMMHVVTNFNSIGLADPGSIYSGILDAIEDKYVLSENASDAVPFQIVELMNSIIKFNNTMSNIYTEFTAEYSRAKLSKAGLQELLNTFGTQTYVAYTIYSAGVSEVRSREAEAVVKRPVELNASKGSVYTVRSKIIDEGFLNIQFIGWGDFKGKNMTLNVPANLVPELYEIKSQKREILASKETANTKLKRTVQKADVTNDILLSQWDTANQNLIKQAVNLSEHGDIGTPAANAAVYKIINPNTQIKSTLDIEFVKELIPFVEAFKQEFGTSIDNQTIAEWKSLQATFQNLYETRMNAEDLTAIEKRQLNVYKRALDDSKFNTKLEDAANGALNVAIINTIETGSAEEYSKLYRTIVGRGVGAVASVANEVALTEGIEKTAGFTPTEYEETKLDLPKSLVESTRSMPQEQRAKIFKKFITDRTYLETFLSRYGVEGFYTFVRNGLGISEAAFNKYFSEWTKASEQAQSKAQAEETAKLVESSNYNQATRGVKLAVQRINDLFAGKLDEQSAKTLYNAMRQGRQTTKEAVAQSGHTTAEIYAEIRKYYKPVKSKKTAALKTVVEETTTKVETPTEIVETPSKVESTLEEDVKIAEVAKDIAMGTEPAEVTTAVEAHPEAVVEAVNEVMPTPTADNIERINKTIYENVVENPVTDLISNLDRVLDENAYSKEALDAVQFDKDSGKTHKVASMDVLNDINPVFKSQLDGAAQDSTALNPLVDALIKVSNSSRGFKARMADVILGYIIGSSAFPDGIRQKAINAMSGKTSEAGHTLYVSSTAIHKARTEISPVSTFLEAQAINDDVYTIDNFTSDSEYTLDLIGVSVTGDTSTNLPNYFDTMARESESKSNLSEQEIADRNDEIAKQRDNKLKETRKLNKERVDALEKSLKDDTLTLVEQKALTDELNLRTQLKEELGKKQPDLNKVADIEYRLCDWKGKLQMEQIMWAALLERHIKETKRYTLKDLKNPTIRAEVLQQFADRAQTWRYFSMLSAPTTWFKNIVVNAGMKMLDSTTIMVSTLFDKLSPDTPAGEYKYGVAAKESDAVIGYFEDEFVNNGRMAYLFRQNAIDQNKYALMGDDGKPQLSGEMQRRLNVELTFGNSSIGKIFKKYEAMISFWLNAGDTKSVQGDFSKYLKNILELNVDKLYAEIKADPSLKDSIPDMTEEQRQTSEGKRAIFNNIPSDTLDLFVEKALTTAAKTYFKNTNKLAKFVNTVGAKHPIFRLLASVATPFIKVSSNVMQTILDYSPFGFLNFAKMKAQDKGWIKAELSNIEKAFRKSDEIRVLGKATTGTALMCVGMILAALGWIVIDDDDNWGTVVKIGDIKIRLSDLSPALTPITLGAAGIASAKQGKGFFNGIYKDFSDASLLQTFDSAFEYNSSVADYFKNLATNYTNQYIPSVIKHLAKMVDNNSKQKSSNWFVKYWQSIAENIPLLSYAVPNKVNAYTGDFQKRYGVPFLGAAVNAVSPIKISIKPKSDVEKAYSEVGISAGSTSGTITIDGKKIKITAWKLQELRQVKAKWLNERVKKLTSSNTYKSMSKEAKQRALRSLNSKATNYAKKWYKDNYLK